MKLRGLTRSSTATACGKNILWYKREDSEHYLFIYLFTIPQRGTFLCGKDIRGLGEEVRWALREADFNRPHTYLCQTNGSLKPLSLFSLKESYITIFFFTST